MAERGTATAEERMQQQALDYMLTNPNATQRQRDLALSIVNDKIGMGARSDGVTMIPGSEEWTADPNQYPEGSKYYKQMVDWGNAEGFERELLNISEEEAVAAAARACMVDDTKIKLTAAMNDAGVHDPRLAYPKIVRAATRLAEAPRPLSAEADERWADAHIILAFFSRAVDPEESIAHYKKAITVRPGDCRLRNSLGSLYMRTDRFSLALQQITLAVELATDPMEKWQLSESRAKVLNHVKGREEEAVELLQQVVSQYDEFKDHPEMDDKKVGHIAVAQYMLCQRYAIDNRKKQALRHFKEAESKRNSMDPAIAKTINWQNRVVAQMFVASTTTSILSHRECHYCGETTDSPKRCAKCKEATYCSRECQVAHWTTGHKRQCQATKMERKRDKEASKQTAKDEKSKREKMLNTPPLDGNLDPHKLWAQGVKLSKQDSTLKEAAWKFLVALFMDFSLEANNMAPVRKAAEACPPDDPVGLALVMIARIDRQNPLERCKQINLKSIDLYGKYPTYTVDTPCEAETLDGVDKGMFGLAMCKIFFARILGRCFAVRSMDDANNPMSKQAFEDALMLINDSTLHIDVDRWLTMQFELGYSNVDVGASEAGKGYLTKFIAGVEALRKNSGGKIPKHWRSFKPKAEQKLSYIPLIEYSHKTGMMS